MCNQQFIGRRGEALAEGCHLSGNVVRPSRYRKLVVLNCTRGEAGKNCNHLVTSDVHRGENLQLLDILRQITTRHPLVDVFMSGQSAELLDPSLHIVTSDGLPAANRLEIHLVDDCLIRLHNPVGHINAEILLRLEHRNPELPLKDNLVLG